MFNWVTAYSSSWREAKAETQGRELGIGIKVETMEEWYLLACSHDLLSLLSWIMVYHPELPSWGSTTQSGLGTPTLIINQENVLQTSLQKI